MRRLQPRIHRKPILKLIHNESRERYDTRALGASQAAVQNSNVLDPKGWRREGDSPDRSRILLKRNALREKIGA
jgi:hypothetical protein